MPRVVDGRFVSHNVPPDDNLAGGRVVDAVRVPPSGVDNDMAHHDLGEQLALLQLRLQRVRATPPHTKAPNIGLSTVEPLKRGGPTVTRRCPVTGADNRLQRLGPEIRSERGLHQQAAQALHKSPV